MNTPAELSIVHDTRYAYASPVSLAHHLAHLKPIHDAHQQLIDHRLQIEPAPQERQDAADSFGNSSSHFTLVQPHDALEVRSSSHVRVTPRFVSLDAAASPPWEAVRDRLRYVARADFDPAVEFVQPSPYVPRLEALRAYALPSFPRGVPIVVGALDLMSRIHAEFSYRADSTEVDTPLAEAFEHRTGVCQDFTHVMTGCLRMLGLPARYVSGYLLTRSSADGQAMVGADASHAWVQIYAPQTPGVPDTGPGANWLDLDPTNDLVPATDHVRVAIGRDYGDVAPLRGVIRGGGRHTLAVGVHTRRVDTPTAVTAVEAG